MSLEQCIRLKIRDLRQNHITGMSIRNLKMLVDTSSLDIGPNQFHSSFEVVAHRVATEEQFPIIAEGLS